MENQLHRLLKRQISKHFGQKPEIPGINDFISAINDAYISFDDDHRQLERTLEISSQELFKANQELNHTKNDLEKICKRALNYSYIDIQKELKDRIKFIY